MDKEAAKHNRIMQKESSNKHIKSIHMKDINITAVLLLKIISVGGAWVKKRYKEW